MRSIYDISMIPMEKRGIRVARKELIPKAYGDVLELGAGTGVNLKYYDYSKVDSLLLTDRRISKTLKKIVPKNATLKEIDAMTLPFPDNSFDCIVHTLVFCMVKDVDKGLQEIKRVLKPNGTLLFIEHIDPENKTIRNFFKVFNPFWKVIVHGCNLNRHYDKSLESNGFVIKSLKKFMRTVFIYGEAFYNND